MGDSVYEDPLLFRIWARDEKVEAVYKDVVLYRMPCLQQGKIILTKQNV